MNQKDKFIEKLGEEIEPILQRLSKEVRKETLEEVLREVRGKTGWACPKGLCGHSKVLEPNAVNHGEFLGKDKAYKEIQSLIEQKLKDNERI